MKARVSLDLSLSLKAAAEDVVEKEGVSLTQSIALALALERLGCGACGPRQRRAPASWPR